MAITEFSHTFLFFSFLLFSSVLSHNNHNNCVCCWISIKLMAPFFGTGCSCPGCSSLISLVMENPDESQRTSADVSTGFCSFYFLFAIICRSIAVHIYLVIFLSSVFSGSRKRFSFSALIWSGRDCLWILCVYMCFSLFVCEYFVCVCVFRSVSAASICTLNSFSFKQFLIRKFRYFQSKKWIPYVDACVCGWVCFEKTCD